MRKRREKQNTLVRFEQQEIGQVMLPLKVGDSNDDNLSGNVGATCTRLHVSELTDEGIVIAPSTIKVHKNNGEALRILHTLLKCPQSFTPTAHTGNFKATTLQHELERLAITSIRDYNHGPRLSQAATFQAVGLACVRALLTLAPILGADGGALRFIESVGWVAIHFHSVSNGSIIVGRRRLLKGSKERILTWATVAVDVLFQVEDAQMVHCTHIAIELQAGLIQLGGAQGYDDAHDATDVAPAVGVGIGHQNCVHLAPPLGLQAPVLFSGVIALKRSL